MNVFEFANLHPIAFCFTAVFVLLTIVKVTEYLTLPQCKHCRNLNNMSYDEDEDDEEEDDD